MVADYHLIWNAYGWWLPNDPRGSSSHEIRVGKIMSLGELHQARKLVAVPKGRRARDGKPLRGNASRIPVANSPKRL